MYMLEISIPVYLCWKKGREARDNPCGLPNIDTDFCEYVRSTDFRAYLEGRKETMILDYLLQIEISLYMLEIQISVYIWRKEGKKNNPSELSITDPDFCVYVSSDVIIHPSSFTFSFLETSVCVWIIRVTFCVVNLFLCIFFFFFLILSIRDSICYLLSLSDWFQLVCNTLRSILVTFSGIISVAFFHGWMRVHCIYVPHLL